MKNRAVVFDITKNNYENDNCDYIEVGKLVCFFYSSL